jgi:hypothetical protein
MKTRSRQAPRDHPVLLGFPWLWFILTLLSGCIAAATVPTEEPEPPFQEEVLDSLKGSTKQEVRQKFGAPLYEFDGAEKSYFLYEGRVDTAGIYALLGIPIPVWPDTNICSLLEFGPDKRLKNHETYGAYVGIGGPGGSTMAEDCRDAFWSDEERVALRQVTPYKRRGADKYFETWWKFCHAAHRGDDQARFDFGNSYRWGRGPVESDHVRAYLWYTLAGNTGYAALYKDQEAAAMTPEQLADAERLVAEWQPNPAECDKVVQTKH